MNPKTHVLEVWGDFACFTRPELKVERFSYPVPTPSAARGIFEAVYAKPAEFSWRIHRVDVLNPPSYIALRRNEVKDKANVGAIGDWMTGKKSPEPIWADGDKAMLGTDQKGRTQRQTMALKDVRFRLHGEIRPWLGYEDKLAALEAQFRRRASTGKCFHQPSFGCREFVAFFKLVEANEILEAPIPIDLDIGLMVYDVFDLSRPGGWFDPPRVSLFQARVAAGVLQVPDYESADVLKPSAQRSGA